MNKPFLGLLLSSLLLAVGCNRDNAVNGPSGPPKVVVTTTMIGDLVREVAGDTVELDILMGPGVDPHLYQPKASDMRKMQEAALVFYNGLHLEGNMIEFLEKQSRGRAVTRDIPPSRLLTDAGQPDPHVWFDVRLWIIALNTVEKDLCEAFPEQRATCQARAAEHRKKLEALDEEVRTQIGSIPKRQRVLITAHDAFRYFGRAYDIEVMGLQGVSTADETGLRAASELADRIVRDQVKAIFMETSVPPDGVRKVLELCQSRGYTVRIPDGMLYSDAMDKPGTEGGTYPGMVRHNVRLIVQALK